MNKDCAICGTPFELLPKSKRQTCSRACAVSLSWKNPKTVAKRAASISVAHSTPEARARTVETNNRRWARPGEREKLATRNREMWAKPRMRKRLSKAIRVAQRMPEQRMKHSLIRKEAWTDPDVRARMVEGMRRAKGTPEARAKFSALLTERWNDPGMRAKMASANAARVREPKHRANMSAKMKERWQNDEHFRAAVLAGCELYNKSPEGFEQRSTLMKALWADPIWRMRQLSLVAESVSEDATDAMAHLRIAFKRQSSRKEFNSATDLMESVARALPPGLPDFMKTDVSQDLFVSLLEGSLKLSDLNGAVKKHLTAYRRMFPDMFGPISIDAPIPGTDGLTIGDTLSNDTPHF